MMSTPLMHGLIFSTFLIGYALIIFETKVKINKTAPALLIAVLTWMFLFVMGGHTSPVPMHALAEHVSSVSQIIFFLIGAMTIVELIDSHKGFKVITDLIQTNSKRKLLWLLGFLAFFLSAILDNLTTTIVMISLLRKIVPEKKERLLLSSMIVIAANAGGAWTPIGDVTTTMLWINGNLTTLNVMRHLFLPSMAALLAALGLFSIGLKGTYPKAVQRAHQEEVEPGSRLIFFCGLATLIFVPLFKALTGLPPFMGMLIGVGILWMVTDLIHGHEEARQHLRIPHILTKIDISGILFFLGILLCVGALDAVGLLSMFADLLDRTVQNLTVIATIIGVISAIVDNVPLVAAGMGMYDLATHPVDSYLWQLLAYCAGTGGSILIIGSAAGVALMSLEKIDFLWYTKKISLIAFISYLTGIAFYLLQQAIFPA